MEIRTLRYFVAVAREENMTKAALQLHVTQPTLSKALKSLEDELGKKLFVRRSFNIRLTGEGVLLQKKAVDLLNMADQILSEFRNMDDITGGEVYFGMAESYQIRHLARIIRDFVKMYPSFRYHITSGDMEQVTEKLNKGLLDFAVLVNTPNSTDYDFLRIPETNRWCLIMPANDPLAKKESITFSDVLGLPLFVSEQSIQFDLPKWCGNRAAELTIKGRYRLAYNSSIFTKEGLGYLLALEHLIDTGPQSGLIFRPLFPTLESSLYIIWRKHQVLSPIAQRFQMAAAQYCSQFNSH